MLKVLEVDATALQDEFAVSIEDPDFLEGLRNRFDVYVTYDHAQKNRRNEARAIRESGVTALWFAPFWGKLKFWDQAKWLITHWQGIQSFCKVIEPGTCAELKANGRARTFDLPRV